MEPEKKPCKKSKYNMSLVNCKKNWLPRAAPKKDKLADKKPVLVDFDFVMIIIDGKVLAYITNTKSMQSCSIGNQPNEMRFEI